MSRLFFDSLNGINYQVFSVLALTFLSILLLNRFTFDGFLSLPHTIFLLFADISVCILRSAVRPSFSFIRPDASVWFNELYFIAEALDADASNR